MCLNGVAPIRRGPWAWSEAGASFIGRISRDRTNGLGKFDLSLPNTHNLGLRPCEARNFTINFCVTECKGVGKYYLRDEEQQISLERSSHVD